VPGRDILPFLAFYASNLIVYWAGWDVNWKLFVAIALGFVLLAVFHLTGKGDTPPLDWRSGASWTLPWLGGLALISWIGAYPEKSKHAGNLDAVGFGWGFLLVLALTAGIYVLAMRMRLPRGRVETNIEQTMAEAEEERGDLAEAH
jgi:predicted cobalt transporter CbtA